MAYASDRMDQKREQQKRYKEAVERRLSKDRKPVQKKDPNEDLLRGRKETGYFGG